MTWWNVSQLFTRRSLYLTHICMSCVAPRHYVMKKIVLKLFLLLTRVVLQSSIYLQLVRVRMHILAILEKLE